MNPPTSITQKTSSEKSGDLAKTKPTEESNLWMSAMEAVGKTVVGGTLAAGYMAFEMGKNAVDSALGHGQKLVDSSTQGVGNALNALNFLNDNPLLRHISKFLPSNWLLGIINRVDVQKAEAAVCNLQQKYPQESPNQIAHRLMVEKATLGGSMGLATSFLPGMAIALLSVDLAATTLLQAEMVYQIAAAYGLDLKDPARKGEVLAIFGLSFGGSRAIKAGISFLKVAPVAGAVIGAGANAAMIYSLGYAACRFYEAKQKSQPLAEVIAATEATSEQYLQVAITQQTIVDRILVHLLLATNPDQSREEVLAALEAANLSPASQEAISQFLQSPEPLEALLKQLNRDYALPLLAQCRTIAQRDRTLQPAEIEILQKIADYFQINLEDVEQSTHPTGAASLK